MTLRQERLLTPRSSRDAIYSQSLRDVIEKGGLKIGRPLEELSAWRIPTVVRKLEDSQVVPKSAGALALTLVQPRHMRRAIKDSELSHNISVREFEEELTKFLRQAADLNLYAESPDPESPIDGSVGRIRVYQEKGGQYHTHIGLYPNPDFGAERQRTQLAVDYILGVNTQWPINKPASATVGWIRNKSHMMEAKRLLKNLRSIPEPLVFNALQVIIPRGKRLENLNGLKGLQDN